jgi:hypothetical protein
MQTRISLRKRVMCERFGCAGEGFPALQPSLGGPACMIFMEAVCAVGCKADSGMRRISRNGINPRVARAVSRSSIPAIRYSQLPNRIFISLVHLVVGACFVESQKTVLIPHFFVSNVSSVSPVLADRAFFNVKVSSKVAIAPSPLGVPPADNTKF